MPYIKVGRRIPLDEWESSPAADAGELNWRLSTVIKQYLDSTGPRYSTINDILGALEGAKLEFYRRIAGPYEEIKIRDNGDIY